MIHLAHRPAPPFPSCPLTFRRSQAAAAFLCVLLASLFGAGCNTAHAADPTESVDPIDTPLLKADPQVAPAHDKEAATWLERLEAAAAEHHTLRARVRMRSIQDLLDDETIRFGDMGYARGHTQGDATLPTRFAVVFDRLKAQEAALEVINRRYVYDGHWLLDVDAQAHTATRREVVAAEAVGDRAMQWGDGPFLVPLNLKKDRVLERFDVALAQPNADEDPKAEAGSIHLVLTPRANVEMDATQLDLWFDRTTLLPLRAASMQSDGDQTVIDLFEVAVNVDLPADAFNTALPDETGWELQTVPLDADMKP